jgi:hypothetical protein
MSAQPNKPTTNLESTHQKHSFLTAVWISFAIVVGILLLIEGGARLYQNRFPQPIRSIGNFESQFETKWFKLKDYVKENDGVDVLLMGNSMVNTGVDPNVIVKAYEAKTGVKLRIFNFGIEGMDLYTNSELATLLVKEYHPKAILFFTEMREYGPVTDTTVPDWYKVAPWFQYKLGHPSLEGWFYDHSAAMQYFLPFRNWSRSDFPDTFLKDLFRYSQTTTAGYEPDHLYSKDLDVRTDPNDPAQKILFDLYRNFVPAKTDLADLTGILELHNAGVQVMITEMPVYKTYYDYFGGESVHQAFLTTLSELAREHQAAFVPTMDSDLIPRTGRADNHHLNFEGAPLYSQFLGDSLGSMCADQNLCLANEEMK